jgi:hypothetical protein
MARKTRTKAHSTNILDYHSNLSMYEKDSLVGEAKLKAAGAHILAEANSVLATGTGSTRTCKLSIPYSWGLTTQSSDNMTTTYTVVGTTGTTTGVPLRSSTLSPLDTRKVPANGTITALTANVTL